MATALRTRPCTSPLRWPRDAFPLPRRLAPLALTSSTMSMRYCIEQARRSNFVPTSRSPSRRCLELLALCTSADLLGKNLVAARCLQIHSLSNKASDLVEREGSCAPISDLPLRLDTISAIWLRTIGLAGPTSPAMYFQSVQHSRSAVVEKIPTRCAARHRSRRAQPVKATSATFCAGRGVPCGFNVGRLERLVLQVRAWWTSRPLSLISDCLGP
jgi:hypothetical protein